MKVWIYRPYPVQFMQPENIFLSAGKYKNFSLKSLQNKQVKEKKIIFDFIKNNHFIEHSDLRRILAMVKNSEIHYEV